MDLDRLDRAILRVVQTNNQRSYNDIGEEIGLSASAVRRRVNLLREAGIIERDVSMIAVGKIGITLIVTITFENESIEIYDNFDGQVARAPEILQSYHIAGSDDYLLIVSCQSLEWYEEWSKLTFMSNPAIKRYDTRVVWSRKKFETAIPI